MLVNNQYISERDPQTKTGRTRLLQEIMDEKKEADEVRTRSCYGLFVDKQ